MRTSVPRTQDTAPVPVFCFPATAALLLGADSYLGPVAIGNWLRNYGAGGHSDGSPFTVLSRRPYQHYRVQAGAGGFYVMSGTLDQLPDCSPRRP